MAEDTPVATPTAQTVEQPERVGLATATAQEKASEKKTESETKPSENATATEEKKEPEDQAKKSAATEEPAESPAKAAAPVANGTPSSAKKSSKDRRRSSGGNKKLSRKKSMNRITHLNAKPGEYYLARLRSFPPWPAIICDEQMLPHSLLITRPVTAMQPDGTYHGEYADSGKRTHERTFPVMFFETNEFAWIPNTQLNPLEAEECKDVSEKNKSKLLLNAYKIAAEGHDLQYFKNILADHQAALEHEIQEREAQEEAKAAAKAEKKGKRKSKGADADVDVEDDKKKGAKKRKKDADTDGEADKATKTPKTGMKLKLTTPKAPGEESGKKTPASKKKASGSKKAKAGDEEAVQAPEPEKPVDPEELKKKKEKEILFLRHRLQKAFISRDQPPQEEEMADMAPFFDKLERHRTLEVSIIRSTKINKVLKMIVKLDFIPRDEEFHFRERAMNILSSWKSVLDAEVTAEPASKEAKPTANGAHKEDEGDTPKLETEEEKEPEKTAKEDTADTPMPDAEAKNEAAEGDKAREQKQPAETKSAEEKAAEVAA